MQLASFMLEKRALRIDKAAALGLGAYSEERMAHLLAAGGLAGGERPNEPVISFSHEGFWAYLAARWLSARHPDITRAVAPVLGEWKDFRPFASAARLLAEMIDVDSRLQLLHCLANAAENGRRLACEIILDFNISSDDIWVILESITESWIGSAQRILARIGASQPERALRLLTKMLLKAPVSKWHLLWATSFGETLGELCQKEPYFIRAAESFLGKESRYQQIGLIALCVNKGYGRWPELAGTISRFAISTDGRLREVSAYVLRSLAQHDADLARELLKRLACDATSRVRRAVGESLSTLASTDDEWFDVLACLARSEGWRERHTAIKGIIVALEGCHAHEVPMIAERLVEESRSDFFWSLVDAMQCVVLTQEQILMAVLPLLEKALSRIRASRIIKDADFICLGDNSLDVARAWARSKNPQLRQVAACNCIGWGPEGVELARNLAVDPSSDVKLTLAEILSDGFWADMPEAPNIEQIVAALANDPDARVRALAHRAAEEGLHIAHRRCMPDGDL